jgi:hypothetical protein
MKLHGPISILPSDNIGFLLPSSVGVLVLDVDILIVA